MQPHSKRRGAALAAALLVVLAISVTGAALAANSSGAKQSVFHATAAGAAHANRFSDFGGRGGPGGESDDIAAAADYLGVTTTVLQSDLQAGKTLAQVAGTTSGRTVDGLIAALVAAEKTELDAKVTAGTLTQAQETALLPTLTQRFTDFVNGTGGPGFGHGGPGGRCGQSDDIDAAAAYLGVTSTVLQSDLQTGKTLAQVAGATSGKTVDGLIAALVAAEKTELDAKVTAGTLTQAQETAMLPTLTQRFTDFVNGTHRPGGGH